jgi:hypothetical protein
MSKAQLMTIKLDTDIVIAKVSFAEGFVCLEEIETIFEPIITSVRKKRGLFDDPTQVVWVESDEREKVPIVYPSLTMRWGIFGKDLNNLTTPIFYRKDFNKIRKDLGYEN